MGFLEFVALTVVAGYAAYAASRSENVSRGFGRVAGALMRGPGRLRLGHVMLGLGLIALLFFLTDAPPGPSALLGLVILAVVAREWVREWSFLMDLSDADLPGRHDKLIWAFMMVALAPVGVWLFRSFRLRHWPETAGAAEPKPAPVPELF